VPISITYDLTSTSTFDQVVAMLSDVTEGYAPLPLIVGSTTAGIAQTFTATTTLISGHAYSFTAILQNSVTGATLQNTVSACDANAGAGSCLFAVISNPLGASLGVNSLSSATTFSLATATCDVANWTGCFQNALVWALYPSSGALTDVADASSAVRQKPPFGYIFVYIAAVQTLNASGTPPVALAADAPITTYIFAPFDTALGVMLFFFFGIWFFLRLRKIEL